MKKESVRQLEARNKAAKQSVQQHGAKLKKLKNPTKKHASEPAPKSTTAFVHYRRMMEDGVCEIEPGLYSRTFQFSDINYKDARKEDQLDIFSRYCEALNYCDPSVHLQMTFVNRHVDPEQLAKTMFFPCFEDDLDRLRKEMNTMLAAKAQEGKNGIMHEKYITFTTPADTLEDATPILSRLEADLTGYFRGLGSCCRSLTGLDRLMLLHEQFRPDEPFSFQYNQLPENGLTTRSIIAPASLDFTDSRRFHFDDNIGQCLYLQELPKDLTDKVLTDITELPFNLMITLHIHSVDQTEGLEFVQKQIGFMEMEVTEQQKKAIRANESPELAVPIETRRSYDEAMELLDSMENKDQRLFKVTMLIYTYAKDEDELDSQVSQIIAAGRKNNVRLNALVYQQREALNSILPIGYNPLPIERTLTTASTAIMIPFTTQELYQPGGIYYGLNTTSRNLIFFDRRSLDVASGMILGKPGGGKSFAAKREMTSVLLMDPDSEVIVIDPEREYMKMAQGFGDISEVIPISAGSRHHINPMDINMDYAGEEDPLSLKAEFILSICELLAGGRQGLTAQQVSVCDRAITMTYQPFFAHHGKGVMPTLKDFYTVLKAQPESEAASLALSLEVYINGSLSVFAQQTNVNTDRRFIIYDVKDLGKKLRTLGMLIVLDQIWNRITANRQRGKHTWLYIDELQLLFSNQYCANYFFELWSRARKWGCIPTGITQNVETLLLSDTARRMLSNSSFVLLLNQAASDRQQLSQLLNISDRQMSYVTNARAGQGLLMADGSVVPFDDKFPKDTELYRLMTTKIEESIPAPQNTTA